MKLFFFFSFFFFECFSQVTQRTVTVKAQIKTKKNKKRTKTKSIDDIAWRDFGFHSLLYICQKSDLEGSSNFTHCGTKI